MHNRWRSIVRLFHPEGIPSFFTRFYNLVSGTAIFQRHYDLVAADIGNYCREGTLLDIGTGPGWLHSFEEPFYSVDEMESLSQSTPFENEGIHFTGAFCCLVLKKK